jgi:hypothetical protein
MKFIKFLALSLIIMSANLFSLTVHLEGGLKDSIGTCKECCRTGTLTVKAGVVDFTNFLATSGISKDKKAVWPSSLETLDENFNSFLYSEVITLSIDPKNFDVEKPTYSIDITRLATWAKANNPNKKPLGFVFIPVSGDGKLIVDSDESFSYHSFSTLISVRGNILPTDPFLFRYDPYSFDVKGGMQYSGHVLNGTEKYNHSFTLSAATGEKRAAFYFNRPVAVELGWSDPERVGAKPFTAAIEGYVHSGLYDGDPSCSPGTIIVRAGIVDFTPFLSLLTDPDNKTAVWPDGATWLSPSFNEFLYSETLSISGADINLVPSGTPYNVDITGLINWAFSNNSEKKPLGLVFLTIGGEGKINLLSDESFSIHPQKYLIGTRIKLMNGGEYVYRHNTYDAGSSGSMQYTGHCRQSNRYKNDHFVLGDHQKLMPDGSRVDKDRCAFFFHRELARVLGWKDETAVQKPLFTARIKGFVNSRYFGTDPSCLPGDIRVAVCVADFSEYLNLLSNPYDLNAKWPTPLNNPPGYPLAWLNPSFSNFLYAETLTIQGADINLTPTGTPYEIDISGPALWAYANNQDKKPLGFLFITLGGTGKINLYSDERGVDHDKSLLLGLDVTLANGGTYRFCYDSLLSSKGSMEHRMQYSGHCRQNIPYTDGGFVIGEHNKVLASGTVVDKDRCAFFFHRGFAKAFRWFDSLYDSITAPDDFYYKKAVKDGSDDTKFAVGASLPNPFRTAASIRYSVPLSHSSKSVKFTITDIAGRIVYQTVERKGAGMHHFNWNAKGFNNGMYVLSVHLEGNQIQKRKLILVR